MGAPLCSGYLSLPKIYAMFLKHIFNPSHVSWFIRMLNTQCWNDNFNPKTCHVVPALIKRILDDENPFIVWGTPDVVRDFLYVKDVIRCTMLTIGFYCSRRNHILLVQLEFHFDWHSPISRGKYSSRYPSK